VSAHISPLRYHRVTSYLADRPGDDQPHPDPLLAPGFVSRAGARPAEVKSYDDGETVLLPVELPGSGVPAGQVLAGGPPAARAGSPDLAALATLLYYSAGVVRYRDYPETGRLHFRAAGSAGNLHPLELYVVARNIGGLPDGVWHHDPLGHRLRRVGDAPRAGPPYLVITGVPGRTGWKYAERGYRHLWWDAGTLTAQLLALAGAAGLPGRVRLLFPDSEIAAGTGAAWPHEFPLALVLLGDGQPGMPPPAAIGGRVGADLPGFPLITAVQAGTRTATDRWGSWPAPAGTVPAGTAEPAGTGDPGEPLEQVILRRGSTRRFDPAATLPARALTWAMAAATRPVPWDAGPSLLDHRLLVHAVDGLRPGRYRWAGGGPELLAPGPQRGPALRLCLDQRLAHDAAYVAVHCADIEASCQRLGPRGYRAAQFEAGLVEGRLHLAAFTLGFGATGLTFLDDLVPALLHGPPALLVTAIGQPAYRAVPGGPPLRPACLHA
jgi:SagB-type dehydrogenase family enzyme